MDAYIARSNGATKLEYQQNGAKLTRLWEPKGEHTLETTFNEEGAILKQEMKKLAEPDVNEQISLILKNAGVVAIKEQPYQEIKLNKKCPKCSNTGLSRHADAFSTKQEIPIMPLYHCKSCGSQSYYLTDSYLEQLVLNNKDMFEGKELSELDANKQAFMDELKAYIIRIFASKKIMCIK